MEHLPNIRHKRTITPEDWIYRINLYATWVHILNGMVQSLAGHWHKLSKAAAGLKGAWRIQSDADKVVKTLAGAQVFLDKFTDRLDSCDLADWRNVRDDMAKVHDREAKELNSLMVFFGRYYEAFYGRPDKQEALLKFMEDSRSEYVSGDATDVFALNYIYTINVEENGNSSEINSKE